MAVDKLVDSTQLDADLESVADAIRAKGGTSADLAFPAGFVSAIAAIPAGGGAKVDLLHTLTITDSNEQFTVNPTSSWADYDFILVVPDLTVTAQEGQTNGNWLWFQITGNRGNTNNYEGYSNAGRRTIQDCILLTKGWYGDRYYFRWVFLTGRGGSLQLKTVQDIDSENYADLTYKFGGYNQGTYGLLNGTVKFYGGKL